MRRVILALAGMALALALFTTPSAATTDSPTHTQHVAVVDNHIDPFWPCVAFKPHTGDANPWYHVQVSNTLLVEQYNCAATHPCCPSYDHIYHVTYNKINGQYTWGGGWV